MLPTDDDDLDAQLRALPQREVDPAVDARVLRTARAALERPRSRARGWLDILELVWSRAIGPALVTGTVASYLVWAVQSTNALYH